MEKMRVLLVSPLPPPNGGVAIWTKTYLSTCEGEGIQADVVNSAVVGRRVKNIASPLSLFEEVYRTISILVRLSFKCRRLKPDVVHINTACSRVGIIRDWFCVRLAPRSCKVVLHCHCTTRDQLRNSWLGNWFFRKSVQSADYVLVLNSASKRHVDAVGAKRSSILPNAVNAELIRNEGKICNLAMRNVLFTGHVIASKGIDEIIEVANKKAHYQFRIAGAISPKYISMKMPPNLELLGELSREDVMQLLDEADVFLFPSHTEGFSTSVLEAMARGVPIIATDVGANRDMIGENGGRIVPVQDVGALLEKMEELEDVKLREEMSRWNVDRVKTKYMLHVVMRELKDIYQSM